MRILLLLAVGGCCVFAQGPNNSNDQTLKALDDIEWRLKLGDIADVDKIAYTSLPPAHIPNRDRARGGQSADHSRLYVHPQEAGPLENPQPLLVLAHQGIHGNVSSCANSATSCAS